LCHDTCLWQRKSSARDCDRVDGDGLIIRVKGPSVTAVLRFTSPVRGSRRAPFEADDQRGLEGSSRASVVRVSSAHADRAIRDALLTQILAFG
jgi:hypothetical protein